MGGPYPAPGCDLEIKKLKRKKREGRKKGRKGGRKEGERNKERKEGRKKSPNHIFIILLSHIY